MIDLSADGDAPDAVKRGRVPAGQDPVKRKQIIDGARRVFIEMGFDAASMNDITRAAGVSKGTIYVYFANKEELFEALIEDERKTIFNDLYNSLDGNGEMRESLIRFGLALARKITMPKVIMAQRTVIGASERIPELGKRFYESGPKIGHERVMTYLRKAIGLGLVEIADVDLAAYQLSDLCVAGLFRQMLFGYRTELPDEKTLEHIVSSGVDVFLKAYGTQKLAELESPSGRIKGPRISSL